MINKNKKEFPIVKTVKCRNCIKYKSGIWVDCEGKKMHCETSRVCDIFEPLME